MHSCFSHPNALNSCPPCALSHPFKMRVCEVRWAEAGLHLVLAHLGKCSGFTKQNVFQGLLWQVPACLPFYLVERQPPRSLQPSGGLAYLLMTLLQGKDVWKDVGLRKGWESQRLCKLVAEPDTSFWNLLHFMSSTDHAFPLFLHLWPPSLAPEFFPLTEFLVPHVNFKENRKMHSMCF